MESPFSDSGFDSVSVSASLTSKTAQTDPSSHFYRAVGAAFCGGLIAKDLYLTLGRVGSGQQRPFTAISFSRIGPKLVLSLRGAPIQAWICWTTRGESGRGPETGTLRRMPVAASLVVSDPYGKLTEAMSMLMSRRNSPETRNPAGGSGGVSVSLRSSSSKVDGSGNGSAECKRNLLDHPDERQA